MSTTAPRPVTAQPPRDEPTPGAEAAAPKVSVRGLDFYYGRAQALHSITLDVPARQVTAFIGPSGCGKSTLLRTLNRMNDTIPGSRVEGEVLEDGLTEGGL